METDSEEDRSEEEEEEEKEIKKKAGKEVIAVERVVEVGSFFMFFFT